MRCTSTFSFFLIAQNVKHPSNPPSKNPFNKGLGRSSYLDLINSYNLIRMREETNTKETKKKTNYLQCGSVIENEGDKESSVQKGGASLRRNARNYSRNRRRPAPLKSLSSEAAAAVASAAVAVETAAAALAAVARFQRWLLSSAIVSASLIDQWKAGLTTMAHRFTTLMRLRKAC